MLLSQNQIDKSSFSLVLELSHQVNTEKKTNSKKECQNVIVCHVIKSQPDNFPKLTQLCKLKSD